MLYTDTDFYINKYGGSIQNEKEFEKLVKRASRLIDVKTHGRAAGAFANEMKENISFCCCELIDILHRQDSYNSKTDGGLVISDSNDGYAVTYAGADAARKNINREINAVCESYLLCPVNLMLGWI